MQRKLTAIMSADVVGYSGLMEADETGTLERLKANRTAIFDPHVATHGGRVFKLMGDGALVEFSSVVAAVDCALAIQEATEKAEQELSEAKRIRYRIGVNLGDIIIDGDDIYGDGVNVAARLQTLAPVGGIALSKIVRDSVEGKTPCAFEDMGEHTVKNIERPVHVFSVRPAGSGAAAASPAPVAKASLPLPLKPSIVVLPFVNLSGDPEQEYFADGMVEEVTTALSRFKSIFVIASASGLSFKGKSTSPQEIARQLGVRYVLEGSVRKSADRVRIGVKLIDAADGVQIWADRFDDTLEDVFALQDKVALSIAGVVEPALDALETRRTWLRPSVDIGSYDLWLRASSLWRTFTKADTIEALGLLNRAIALDPHFALAASLAARCHGYIFANGWSDDPQHQHRQGVELAHRALQLGSDDPDVLTWVALSLLLLGEELTAAIALMERALVLNPGSAQTWYFGTFLRLAAGEPDRAVEHLEKSTRLDPLASPNKPLLPYAWGYVRFLQERFEEAAALLTQAVQRTQFPAAYALLAASRGHAGQIAAAQDALHEYNALTSRPVESFRYGVFEKPEYRKLFLKGIALAEGKEPTEIAKGSKP
jgi:adenylate cyclase